MGKSSQVSLLGAEIVDTISAMESIVLEIACNLFNTSPDQLTPLSGGHYNAVYQFPIDGQSAILRIGVEDSPRAEIIAMLEWVDFLAQNGAPVSKPLPSVNRHLLESVNHYGTRYTVTACEEIEGTLAENIPIAEWSDALFQSIGKAAGKFHAVSSLYKPRRRAYTRPQWFDSYEIRAANEKLASTNDPAGEKLKKLMGELRGLPTEPNNYGMIHGDLHFANFLISREGEMAIIDFDDCVYGWYCMDIALALLDILVLHNASNEAEAQDFARRFLKCYLAGYRQEKELPLFWQGQIPRFMKLKEICIYSDLIGHPDIASPGSWVGRFMDQRETRIANDIPYVDIDFSDI